jgi:hypothetical protein
MLIYGVEHRTSVFSSYPTCGRQVNNAKYQISPLDGSKADKRKAETYAKTYVKKEVTHVYKESELAFINLFDLKNKIKKTWWKNGIVIKILAQNTLQIKG